MATLQTAPRIVLEKLVVPIRKKHWVHAQATLGTETKTILSSVKADNGLKVIISDRPFDFKGGGGEGAGRCIFFTRDVVLSFYLYTIKKNKKKKKKKKTVAP